MKKLIIRLIALVIIINLLPGCNRIMLALQGAHHPRIESKESVIVAANKYNIDTGNLYFISDSAIYSKIYNDIDQLPWIRFFNTDGYEITVQYSTDCSNEIHNSIDSLCYWTSYNIDSTKTLTEALKGTIDINELLFKNKSVEVYDIYAVIYWTVFIGKLNIKHTEVWERKISSFDNLNSKVYMLNCDYLREWDEEGGSDNNTDEHADWHYHLFNTPEPYSGLWADPFSSYPR